MRRAPRETYKQGIYILTGRVFSVRSEVHELENRFNGWYDIVRIKININWGAIFMAKIQKVTGVKKALGDYKKGNKGLIYYNMGQKVVYYEELPDGVRSLTLGPSVVVIGYSLGKNNTEDTMDSLKAKVTAHYLAKQELGLSNYHYAHNLTITDGSDDPRVVAYKKYLQILMTNIV